MRSRWSWNYFALDRSHSYRTYFGSGSTAPEPKQVYACKYQFLKTTKYLNKNFSIKKMIFIKVAEPVLFGRSRSRCKGPAPAPPWIKQANFSMIFSPLVTTLKKGYLKKLKKQILINEEGRRKKECSLKFVLIVLLLFYRSWSRSRSRGKNTRSRSK